MKREEEKGSEVEERREGNQVKLKQKVPKMVGGSGGEERSGGKERSMEMS